MPSRKTRIARHIANFNHPDSGVSSRAEHYLIRYYGVEALEPLLEACGHPNPVVRFRAAWALAYTHDLRAYEAILRLTDDPDEGVRYDATIALGIHGDERAIARLIALISTPDPVASVDSAAAMGLVRLGRPAVATMIALLQSGTRMQRRAAASILGGIRDEAAITPLAALLSSEEPETRIAGIEALAEIGTSECRFLIEECLTDPSERVRETANYWFTELQLTSNVWRVG